MQRVQSDKYGASKFCFQLLIIAVLSYVACYYLLVGKQEKPMSDLWHLNTGPGSSSSSSRGSKPRYLWHTPFLHAVFTPMHWADRRIRSEYWGPDGVIWEKAELSQFELH